MRQRATITFQLVLLLSLLLALPRPQAPRARAAAPAPELWVTNGPVNTTALAGSTLYLGGDFTSVGPASGSFVALDAVTGARDSTFPRFTGAVRAVVADGAGGWYVGGDFTAVDGWPHAYLAHILADDTLDLTWTPAIDGPVLTLILSGTTLYAGGHLHSNLGYLARLDAATGASVWKVSFNEAVRAIAVRGRMVYAGGGFMYIGDDYPPQHRSGLVALDSTTGVLMPWNPGLIADVRALVISGNTLYAGGTFSEVNGRPRNGLAAVDATTAQLTAWNPNANGSVRALALNGNTLYVGGDFTQVGGQARSHLAALDRTTGAATAWAPSAGQPISALALSGNTIYAGGGTAGFFGQRFSQPYLAAFDTTSGARRPWSPVINDVVSALAVEGDVVYTGGEFTSVGAVPRHNLAALDLATGAATAWNPPTNGVVNTLVAHGGRVYAGGDFTQVGGQPRSRLVALDAATGAVAAWNPVANALVNTLAVSGTTVYAGGHFTAVNGQPRQYLAALDATTGALKPWNPSPNGVIRQLAVSGNTVYISGFFFSHVNGQRRDSLAALDATTGALLPWKPINRGYVRSMALAGQTIYAGSEWWESDNGPSVLYLAALDATTGSARWVQELYPSSTIASLAVEDGVLYASQYWELGAYDAMTGDTLPWRSSPHGYVLSMVVCGSWLYAGGTFDHNGWLPTPNIAVLPTTMPSLTLEMPTDITATGATLHGTVTSNGEPARVAFQVTLLGGHYWHPLTVLANPVQVDGIGKQTVSATVRGLRPGVAYAYRLITLTGLGLTVSDERGLITTGHRILLPTSPHRAN